MALPRTDRTWTQEQGVEALTEMVNAGKMSFKRILYNKIDRIREYVVQEFANPTVETVRRVPYVKQSVAQSVNVLRGEIGTSLTLLMDQDMIKAASRMFKSIKQTDSWYEGDYGRLEMTWKGTTYYIGQVKIRFLVQGNNESRLRVYVTDMPSEARTPHPHVNNDHSICLGTWKDMMNNYCKDRWNWLRCLVMIGEFLKVYGPDNPYQKLTDGWRSRKVRGADLCHNCDQPIATCRCVRQGAICPKTGERYPGQLPHTEYCGGCRSWVNPQLVGNRVGMCAYPARAIEWVEQNRPATLERNPALAVHVTRRLGPDGLGLPSPLIVHDGQLYTTPNQILVVGEPVTLGRVIGAEEAARQGMVPDAVLVHGLVPNHQENASRVERFLDYLYPAYGQSYAEVRQRTNPTIMMDPVAAQREDNQPITYDNTESMTFTREWLYRNCFAELPTGTVARCRRPNPDEVEHSQVRQLNILRMMDNAFGDQVRRLGLVEFAVERPRRMVAQVRAVLRAPAYVNTPAVATPPPVETYEQVNPTEENRRQDNEVED